MDNQKPVFKKKLGGFTRESVNSYIEEQNIKFRNTINTYTKTIEEKQEQIKKLSGELDSVKAELDDIKNNAVFPERDKMLAELEAEKAKYAALKEECDKLTEENKSLSEENEKIPSLTRRAEEKEKEIEQLKSALKIKPEEAAENNGDAAFYDNASRQLGSLFIEAKELADKTINDADKKAEKIVAEARLRADSIICSAEDKKRAASCEIEKITNRLSSSVNGEFLKYISQTKENINYLLERNEKEKGILLSNLKALTDNAKEEMDKEI